MYIFSVIRNRAVLLIIVLVQHYLLSVDEYLLFIEIISIYLLAEILSVTIGTKLWFFNTRSCYISAGDQERAFFKSWNKVQRARVSNILLDQH